MSDFMPLSNTAYTKIKVPKDSQSKSNKKKEKRKDGNIEKVHVEGHLQVCIKLEIESLLNPR